MSSEERGIVVGSELTPEQQLAMINDIAKPSYVPRIDLVQANSEARTSGIATDGEYVYNGTERLGKPIVVIPVSWRPHATMFDDQQQLVAESFNPEDETFKMIKLKESGPKVKNERPGTGAQFLCWLPDHGKFGIVSLMKTSRRHIPAMYTNYMHKKAVALSSAPVKAGGNTWQSHVIQTFTGTLDPSKRPSDELTAEAMAMFSAVRPAEKAEPAPAERPR